MSAAGTWNLAMQTPIGERKVTLTLQVAGAALTGKMSAEDGGAVEIYEGKLAGNAASWKANIKNPMPLTLEFAGDVDGDRISGTVSAAVGSWPFHPRSASRERGMLPRAAFSPLPFPTPAFSAIRLMRRVMTV
jgi:hypothetical protein